MLKRMAAGTDTPPLPSLPLDWAAALGPDIEPALAGLRAMLAARQRAGAIIYPPAPLRFAALERTPLAAVKAVILGQDPYHGPGQAHGLAFSVPPGTPRPPSLRNVLKEWTADLGLPDPGHGCLTAWADQGVLLLNTVLTVEDASPGAHARAVPGQGWEFVTSRILRAVSDRPGHAVFILWGAHAQRLAPDIDLSRHLILRSAHPSPLSARHGFFGSRPFSRTNAFLSGHGLPPLSWALPPAETAGG